VPERVGKYTIQETLGSGTSTTVYLADDTEGDRQVALKRLAPELTGDAAFLEGFRRETEVMGRLEHLNCVPVFDFLEHKSRSFIVTEYVRGASLRRVLEQEGRLTPEQALAVTRGVLGGLAFAHELGLVHRDLKPENLVADTAGVCRLTDFGQAIFTGEVSGGPRQSTGAPAYMSPEQVRGEPGDVRSDVYAAGAVIYELLAGRPPFVALSRVAVMKMHLDRQPPDLARVNPRVPARLRAVVDQALAKEPAARYQSAGEFQAVLEEVARDTFGAGWLKAGSIVDLVGTAIIGTAAATEAEPEPKANAVTQVPAVAQPGPAPEPDAPGSEAAEPGTAALAAAPVRRRPPGAGVGLAAALAGLLVGAAVAYVEPPPALGPTSSGAAGSSSPQVSPTPSPPTPSLSTIAALFDNASASTYYRLGGTQPDANYTWGWVKRPPCGNLQADPQGVTAVYRHNGCDPVVQGRGVIGVCVSNPQGSALYQRNARFGDGGFTFQQAAAAGATGDQFGLIDSSPSDAFCAAHFSRTTAATITPIPGAPTPVLPPSPSAAPPSPSPSPEGPPAAASAPADQLLPRAAALVLGLLVALLGIILLRRRGEPQ
jgi:hypothetical protein